MCWEDVVWLWQSRRTARPPNEAIVVGRNSQGRFKPRRRQEHKGKVRKDGLLQSRRENRHMVREQEKKGRLPRRVTTGEGREGGTRPCLGGGQAGRRSWGLPTVQDDFWKAGGGAQATSLRPRQLQLVWARILTFSGIVVQGKSRSVKLRRLLPRSRPPLCAGAGNNGPRYDDDQKSNHLVPAL